MTDNTQIFTAKATGAELERIVANIEQVVDGEDMGEILMACLSIAISLQHPNLTIPQLQAGVQGASEWIVTFLTEMDGEGPIPASKLN